MISRLSGTVEDVGENRAELRQGDFCYEVLIPSYLERELQALRGSQVELFVHHYLEGGPGSASMVPRLVGFTSASDRDFYHQLIKVPGFGAKSALKAMAIPPGEMARAIESENKPALSGLPGIGGRSADKLVAALKGKVSRFVAAGGSRPAPAPPLDEASEEALMVLLKLAYRRPEAEELIRRVRKRNAGLVSAEEIIQAVFKEAGSGWVK